MNKSSIEWTEYTWNPWHGCKKVSPGCKYCYMYRDKEKYGMEGSKVSRSTTSTFNKPLSIKESGMVFTCSWSDWFIEEADEWRDEAWEVIRKTPHLKYQILTKRPERINEHLPKNWGRGWDNVWIGTSIESQDQVYRMKFMKDVRAKVKFVSAEPLIGPLSLGGYMQDIDWLIIGGESGNETGKWLYRECKKKWIIDLMFSCYQYEVPVFVKQLGTHMAKELGLSRHGKKMEEWPQEFRIREWPKEDWSRQKREIKNGHGI